jgi:hypothetical protein
VCEQQALLEAPNGRARAKLLVLLLAFASLMPLLTMLALIFSLIARHHKPTLWIGAMILSGFTAYSLYKILYQGLN